MDFLKLLFPILIIVLIYIIIFIALRIMYKDIKNGGKSRPAARRRAFGLEIINPGENLNLKKGGVIPIQGIVTLGRKEDNLVLLSDEYVSGHHARIFLKNTDYYIEDMASTNGTFLNEKRVSGKTIINKEDFIRIGTTEFKVIG